LGGKAGNTRASMGGGNADCWGLPGAARDRRKRFSSPPEVAERHELLMKPVRPSEFVAVVNRQLDEPPDQATYSGSPRFAVRKVGEPAGDGGAFSLVLPPDPRLMIALDPAVCCGPTPPAASRGMGPQGAAPIDGRCVGKWLRTPQTRERARFHERVTWPASSMVAACSRPAKWTCLC
jgi:hypothetical protein